MFLIQSLTLFLTDKKLDDCSSSTLDFYHYTVGKLLGYMGEKYGEIGVEQLQEHIQEYFLWLKEENSLSPHSYHSHLRGIKVYLNFLFSEGFIDSEIRVPKIRKLDSEIKPLSESDIRRVLNLFDLNSFIGLRDRTLFSLFLDTGIRLGEISSLSVDDVDLRNGYLTVTGKGRKQRYVPFGREMKKLLWRYIKQRVVRVRQGTNHLFITQTGTTITSSGIQMLFRRVKHGLGIKGKFSPHLMRHSFSVNYINNGGDSFSLQRILGHTTQEMTSRYVHLSTTNLKDQHTKYSPIDRI